MHIETRDNVGTRRPNRLALRGVFLAALFGAVAAAGVRAQEAVDLSLEEALGRLDQVSESVRVAAASVDRARGEETQARSGYYPQVGASAGYTRTLQSEFEALQDLGSEFEDLPFGQANRWDLGLSFSQSLWSGGRIGGRVGAAKAGVRAAELGLAAARAAAALELTEAYFDAALTERLVSIAESTLEQADATLAQVRSAREVGERSEFDLLRAQVSRDNQRPLVVERRSARDLAQLRLAQLLELPAATRFHLTTDPLSLADGAFADFAAGSGERAPLAQAIAALDAREALRRAAHGERLPDVGFSSSYGRVAYPSSGAPAWGDTRTNWTVGVGLTLPLFTGGRLRGLESAAQADLDAAKARQQQVRELADLESQQVDSLLSSAQALWEASAGTVEQAKRAYEIAELRYREGLSTQVELSDSRLALEVADATRAVAARNLAVARARVALLPNLPLGGAAQPAAETNPSIDRSGGR
jgi:outer membrane protein TolC